MKVYLWGQIRIGEISLLFMYTTPGYNIIVYLFFFFKLTHVDMACVLCCVCVHTDLVVRLFKLVVCVLRNTGRVVRMQGYM